MTKARRVLANALPILLMEAFIPLIKNDYKLTLIFVLIIAGSFLVHREKKEFLIFIFGFCIMIISEYLFVSTGAEIFMRNSLFGVMPLWLPFLWGYCFVAIKRGVVILGL